MSESDSGVIKVLVEGREGAVYEVLWQPDQSLMEAIRDGDLPILASCGGNCICATCHVYVQSGFFKATGTRSSDEQELLEGASGYKSDASRLSCQIRHSATLVGLKVRLAPYD